MAFLVRLSKTKMLTQHLSLLHQKTQMLRLLTKTKLLQPSNKILNKSPPRLQLLIHKLKPLQLKQLKRQHNQLPQNRHHNKLKSNPLPKKRQLQKLLLTFRRVKMMSVLPDSSLLSSRPTWMPISKQSNRREPIKLRPSKCKVMIHQVNYRVL